MKERARLGIILASFIIQPLLSSMFPVWLVPDLIFCVLVVMTMYLDKEELVVPAIMILLLALFSDIYSSQYVGATVIALVVVLVALLYIKKLGNSENILFVIIVAVSTSVIYRMSYWVIYAVMSSPYSFRYMLNSLVQDSIMNIIVIAVVLFVLGRDTINKRRDKYFR